MQPITDLVPHLQKRGWTPQARLRPRHAREVAPGPWSVGCETVDRGYVDFAQVGPHLGELGASAVRLQAGWARCEPVAGGPYQWAWLDACVDGSLAQGVRPWLELSYGNPAYAGGGGIGLSEGIPNAEAALAAWDRWVAAIAERYRDRVDTWEIWNEPSNRVDGVWANPPEIFAAFHARTVRAIRELQPAARIVGLVLGHNDGVYARRMLRALAALGGCDLLDELCLHHYPHNPDHDFSCFADLQRVADGLGFHATLRQGETGAPSDCQRFMALGQQDWSERKQAAWNTRRLLAHHVRGIPMNLFQLADMHYARRDGALFAGYNSKGLVRVRPDLSVAYRKPAYWAAQHVFGLFDGRFGGAQALDVRGGGLPTAHRYDLDGRLALAVWWQSADPPALTTPVPGGLGLEPLPFADPVLVDLLSGTVCAPPTGLGAGDIEVWQQLPLADVPLVLAERAVLHLQPLA